MTAAPYQLSSFMINMILYLLGIGSLVPWNAFVSAQPYFAQRLCDDVELWFGFLYNSSSVTSLLLLLLWTGTKKGNHGRNDSRGSRSSTSNTSTTRINALHRDDASSQQGTPAVAVVGILSSSTSSSMHENQEESEIFHHDESSSSSSSSYYMVMIPLFLYFMVFWGTAVLVMIPHIPQLLFTILTFGSVGMCGAMGAIAMAGMVATATNNASDNSNSAAAHVTSVPTADTLLDQNRHVNITNDGNDDNNNNNNGGGVGVGPLFAGQAVGGVVVSIINFLSILIAGEEKSPSSTTIPPMESTLQSTKTMLCNATTTFAIADEMYSYDMEYSSTSRRTSLDADQHLFSSTCPPYTDIDWGVLSYFGLGCILLITCLVGYHFLYNSLHHRDGIIISISSSTFQGRAGSYDLVDEVVLMNHNDHHDIASANTTPQHVRVSSQNPLLPAPQEEEHDVNVMMICQSPPTLDHFEDEIDNNDDDDDNDMVHRDLNHTPMTTRTVWSIVYRPAIAIFVNFCITLTLFPAWSSSLQSVRYCHSQARIWNDLFIPLVFVWFNVFDLCGRWLAEQYHSSNERMASSLSLSMSHTTSIHQHAWQQKQQNRLVVMAMTRIVFLVLFAMLPTSHTIGSTTTSTMWNRILIPIPSDVFSFFIQAMFALTNGFCLSWSFLVASTILQHEEEQNPIRITSHNDDDEVQNNHHSQQQQQDHQQVEEEKEKRNEELQMKSSEILNLSLSAGLLSGSLLSFVYTAIMTR